MNASAPAPKTGGFTADDITACAAAICGGVLLWIYATLVGGRSEAWDSPVYWQQAYPAGLLFCAWLGWRFPHRAWRWPMVMMASQAVSLAFFAADFSLLPVGIVLFLLLSAPGIGLAVLAARFARRRR